MPEITCCFFVREIALFAERLHKRSRYTTHQPEDFAPGLLMNGTAQTTPTDFYYPNIRLLLLNDRGVSQSFNEQALAQS